MTTKVVFCGNVITLMKYVGSAIMFSGSLLYTCKDVAAYLIVIQY